MKDEHNTKVTVDFKAAISHLNKFITIHENEKQLFSLHLQNAIKNATHRMLRYRAKYGVDMEKVELLRDIVFLGTSLLEQSSNNTRYYKGIVKSCMSIVEIGTGKQFAPEFINKILKSMTAFQCDKGQYFQTESFYFIFKTHFRLKDGSF